MYKGTQFKGVLNKVQQGRWFKQNGILEIKAHTITTPNDQSFITELTGNITVKRNWFMRWFRKVFKGEKIIIKQGDKVYVKFQKPVKTDLTNGWIY